MKTLFQLAALAIIALSTASHALAIDINAGPIFGNEDAQAKCPEVCSGLKWNGQWTTIPGKGEQPSTLESVCGTTVGVDIPVGSIWTNADAQEKCPAQLAKVTWNGNWKSTQPGVMSVCGCKPPWPPGEQDQ